MKRSGQLGLLFAVGMSCLVGVGAFSKQVEKPVPVDPVAYEEMMAAQVSDVYDLASFFEAERKFYLIVVFPDPSFTLSQPSGSILPFPWKSFPPEFVKNLVPEYENSVPVYRIVIMEDPISRETVFATLDGKRLFSLPPAKGYDPFALVQELFPALHSGKYSAERVDYLKRLYDPIRVRIIAKLIPSEYVEPYLYVESRLALEQAKANLPSQRNGLLRSPESASNIVLEAMVKTTNGLRISIGYPDAFTNRLDVFTCSDLMGEIWGIAVRELSTAGTNEIAWVLPFSDWPVRFLCAANADVDADGDGYPDMREVMVYKTDPNDPTSRPVRVSGMVSYAGPETGTVQILTVAAAESWALSKSVALASPGAYTNDEVGNFQAYWIKAFRDVNGSLSRDVWEPWGLFSTNALYVTGDVSGINITMKDEPSLWGTISYSGSATGDIHVLAVTASNSWQSSYKQVISWEQGQAEQTGGTTFASFPLDFSITGLAASNYWIRAFVDENYDGEYTHLEVAGQYAASAIPVSNRTVGIHFTLAQDSDGDGIPDWWEISNGMNPTNATDALGDFDADGMNNLYEYIYALNLTNAGDALEDLDEDGYFNVYECAGQSDPRNPNSTPVPNVLVPRNGSIQSAINSITQDYGIVMLSTGVFAGAGNFNINFQGKRLMLVSQAGAGNTTINCENNGRGFLFQSGEMRASVLSGVKIRKGKGFFGAGIWCENSSPTIQNCVIQECMAQVGGGGMAIYSNASPKIESCLIKGNTAGQIGGGIYCMLNGSAEIMRCTIQENSAYNGGGFGSYISTTWVSRTAIIGNWTTVTNTMGAGALACGGPAPIFENCLFARNRSQNWGGGLAAFRATSTLYNCTFYDNRAGCTPVTAVIAVAYSWGFPTNPANSVFFQVQEKPGLSSAGGGIFSHTDSSIQLRNSILWSNTSGQSATFRESSCTFQYCNVQDVGPEGSNIRTNPSLTFAGYLRPNSPCINAADTNGAPSVDIHGEIRPHGGGVDMGWDEYVDEDSDQLPDWWEIQYFGSPTGATSGADSDGDGVDNLTEYEIGGDPSVFADTDGDGLSDDFELLLGTNPNDWDTDADGMGDRWEYDYGFNPTVSNAPSSNSDGDAWTDRQESDQGTNPLLADTDGDEVLDHLDADPLDPENSQEATAANTTLLTMTIGDSSGSHSERYRMRIGPYDLYMSHVNASDYMFSKTVRVPLGKMYPQSYIESLPDDDDDGDYDAEVSGNGIYVLDTAGVLGGHHEDTGFNSGCQFFSVYILSDSETRLVEPDRKNAYTEEPINVINGNVTMPATDVALPGPFLPLVFGRNYNSRSAETGDLGPCWSHTYEWRLEDRPSDQYMGMLGHWKVLMGGEGSRYWFMVQSNNVFVPPPGEGVVLEALPNGYRARYDGGYFQCFNTNGQLTALTDAFGNELSIARTNPALPSAITGVSDGKGQYLSFEHASGRLVRVRTPSTNLWINFSYNASGELARVERMLEGESAESLYAYDAKCHSLTQYVNALGHDFNYAYSYATNTLGGWTSWGVHMVLRSNEYLHSVDYTNAGPHCSRVDYVRGSETQTLVYAINPVTHLIISIAGPGGTSVVTRTVHDGALNPVEESRHDYARGEYIRMQRSYDARHRVTAQSVGFCTNPPVKGWLYEWDDACGLPSKVTDPCDAKILMSYTNHRIQALSVVGESGEVHRTSFSYSTNGLLLAMTNAMGHWVRYAYNERELLTSVIPQLGPSMGVTYDDLGRPWQMSLPGTGGLRVTTFEHDALGQLKSLTYPDQLFERFAYDSLGNLTGMVDRAGRTASYTYAPTRKLQSVTRYWAEASNAPVTLRVDYDNQFNTLKITDPLGRPAESYTLDLQDRPIAVTNLEGQAMHITYGLDNFVRTIQRFDGTTVSNAYDTQGNLSRVQYAASQWANFEYYANGLLKIASNQMPAYKVVVTNRYDCENRLQQIDFPLGNTWLSYRYHPGGLRSNLCSKAFTNSYQYDEAERIKVISTPLGAFHSQYNTNNGLLESIAYPNGITGWYQYDDLDRVTQISWVRSNVVLRSRAYAYNAIGQITNIVKENGAFTGYAYDSLDRLTAETLYNAASSVVKTTRWQYDLAGNRTNMISNSQTNRYLYEAGNRLSGWNGVVRYQYDNAGQTTNLLRETGKQYALSWTASGQMAAVYTNGAYEESFTYDAFGRMWNDWRRLGLYSLHDGAQVVAESFLTGVPANSYIWGPGIDNLLASQMYKFPTYHTNYFLKDHLGSVMAIANAAGDIIESYDYDAWGAVSMYNGAGTPITTSQVGNIYLWQGRAYYPRTGLYYFRARWYDPAIGRFISKDPIGLSGGLNLYEFCGSDPVNNRDPWGFLTQAQYSSLVQVLAMEKELGTHEAARRISNTFGHPKHQALLQVFNADSGNDSMVNGVDIDWFTDLTSKSDVRFPGFVETQYILGKSYWSISRRVIGYPNGNPWPFQDPGERAAVRKATLGRHYSDFITPEYLEREHPDNDCK